MNKSLYSKLSSKGRITIPAEIRAKMQLSSSSRFEFFNKRDFIILLPINKSVQDLKGLLPKSNKTLSCFEMKK